MLLFVVVVCVCVCCALRVVCVCVCVQGHARASVRASASQTALTRAKKKNQPNTQNTQLSMQHGVEAKAMLEAPFLELVAQSEAVRRHAHEAAAAE